MAKNIYNVVPVTTPRHNAFDLSHKVLGAGNYGDLIPMRPVFCMPGDRMRCKFEVFLRASPLATPAMQAIWATIHVWFVPHRILWKNFEDWIDNMKTGGVLPAFPTVLLNTGNFNDPVNRVLFDGFGLPDPNANSFNISAFPHAAYQLIYNTRYRSQDLITTGLWDDKAGLLDGSNNADSTLLLTRKRAWAHDYFTSCLPTAQKGDPVSLPIGNVTVDEARVLMNTATTGGATTLTGSAGNPIAGKVHTSDPDIGTDNLYAEAQTIPVGATTINDLRTAEALQKWLEMLERSGSRYEELLNAAFNVKIRDSRINRPEYVGGTMSPVLISEVLQQSQTTVDSPQANMAGHGVAVGTGSYDTFSVPEWGYMIPILSIMPEANYFGGIDRHWSTITDPTEFPWPQFAHLGEQQVLNKELDAQHASPNGGFGYLPRFQEHRSIPNKVNGQFIDNYLNWSETRLMLGANPALNQAFIECNPDNNIFAVTDPNTVKWLYTFRNDILAARELPKFGIPSLK